MLKGLFRSINFNPNLTEPTDLFAYQYWNVDKGYGFLFFLNDEENILSRGVGCVFA